MKKPDSNNLFWKGRRRIITFLVFLVFSTMLWLLTKLSKDYSTQGSYTINYIDVPVDKCITSDTTRVNFSFDADGFITLAHNLTPQSERVIDISLAEVPYHKENGNSYSFSSQYVAEKLAHLLSISPSNISMNEANILFDMEPLKSKKVAVELRSEIETSRQYGIYGTPTVTPRTVSVYGPSKILDTLTRVYTIVLERSSVSESLSESVELDLLNGMIKTDSATVNVDIRIEKFTETTLEVPISLNRKANVRVLPETVKVKCMVPLSDFNNIKPEMFLIGVDETQIGKEQILDVVVNKVPDNVKIKGTKPEQVEYLIVK